jgi:chemotaxis protein MotA
MQTFMNASAAVITFGGTFGTIVLAFPMNRLKTLPSVIKKGFTAESFNLEKDIETIVSLNDIVKRKGLLALESATDLYADNLFLQRGITLMLDGVDEEDLRSALETETYFMQKRHQTGISMLEMISTMGPAFGLLGTYLGMIPMLKSMDDPSTLGPLMAVQLLTSLYGSFLANVIFTPLAKRLKTMDSDEVMRRELLIEGLVGILLRKNPRLIREQLNCFVRTRQDQASKRGKKEQQPKAVNSEKAA